ncbi:hypothetical protein ACVWZA_002621 [Sphingomonas sp. UYAg733]
MARGIGRPVGDRDFLARLELESGGELGAEAAWSKACVNVEVQQSLNL